jgi:hypothetical protein
VTTTVELKARVASIDAVVALRLLLLACFAVTVVISWGLWDVRSFPSDLPPNAPLIDLPQVPVGAALLLAMAAMVRWPRAGWAALVTLLGLAMLADQVRMQPEVFSLTILLGATLPGTGPRLIGQAHLVALWFWAGLNKALSGGFDDGMSGFLAGELGVSSHADLIGWALPAAEMMTAALLIFRRTRPLGVALAVAIPIITIITFSPLTGTGDVTNLVVWPWNVAIAAAALVLFTDRLDDRTGSLRSMAPGWLAGAGFLLVMPAGFYVGAVPAYPAHNLYSGNVATATMCSPDGSCTVQPFTDRELTRAPVPPETRVFRAIFDEICEPGDTLRVTGPRFRWTDSPNLTEYACPE